MRVQPQTPKIRRQKAAQRAARRARLDELKMAQGGCVDCGYNEHPAALDWDHRDPALKDRSNGWSAFRPSWSWKRILAEVAKCEIRCANCHRIRTAEAGWTGGAPCHRTYEPPTVDQLTLNEVG